MPTVIALKDASRFFSRANENALRGARIGLLKAGERGVLKIVAEIIPSRSPEPVDRGTYKAGWKTEVVDEDTVAILNPEFHAAIIEFGARAENIKIGTAMLTALSQWALRKGMADDEEEALNIAWAVAKAAKARGIFNRHEGGKGLRILGELKDEYIKTILKEEVVREVERAYRSAR